MDYNGWRLPAPPARAIFLFSASFRIEMKAAQCEEGWKEANPLDDAISMNDNPPGKYHKVK